MRLYKIVILLSIGTGSALAASSLAVYQDSALYRFSPEDTFIGFATHITAKCNGRMTALETKTSCSEDTRLCKERSTLKEAAQKLKAIQANISILNTFISLPQPASLNAENWIDSAQRIGTEQARLSSDEKRLKKEYFLQKEAFAKQAPSQEARYLKNECSNDLELQLPYGQVQFSTYYEADLGRRDEVKVKQYLSVTNRSGIDIEAQNAMFYYRRSHRHISPVRFLPWTVGKDLPASQQNVMLKSLPRAAVIRAKKSMDNSSVRPIAKYLSAREYQIENLSLPSTGEPVNVEVTSWKAPLKCELRAYPYRDTTAFTVCSFKPKMQIERNSWKIKKRDRIVNDSAVGEYNEGSYRLYTEVDPEIKIQRKVLVKRERTTGIFGNTVRKKDGYTLIVTNTSDKSKKIVITERIPTSTTQEIKVKLLEIRSEKELNYQLSKEGKIEIKVPLKANEIRKISIVFEISYDKDLKIKY